MFNEMPIICPVRLCTGHACPGCGLTRAAVAAVQGDFELAWRYHPYVYVLALQALALGALTARYGRSDLRRQGVRLAVANVGALTALWLVRWRFGLLDFVVS